jgi:hypothetical protein
MIDFDTPPNRWLLRQRHAQRQAARAGMTHERTDDSTSAATALGQVIQLDRVLTPAYPQAPKYCACGQLATVYVNSIPMCGRCGLAAMQQTGR